MTREATKRRERRVVTTGPRQIALCQGDQPLSADRPSVRRMKSTPSITPRYASLSEIGMEVMHDESRELLKAAGADVDESERSGSGSIRR